MWTKTIFLHIDSLDNNCYQIVMEALTINKILSNQKNLERILENLREGIIAHDLERKIFYFNKTAETITGYDRKQILGKDCHDVFGEPFCGSKCSFCGERSSAVNSNEYTLTITTKSGESRRVEMLTTMMSDEGDNDVGVLAVFKDVTELQDLRITSGKSVGFSHIIGRDAKMLEIYQQIRDVTDYDFPVHVSGDTGTGKELVANAIHNESRRKGAPFVPINCGALPEGLIESELFGHVKGAFSGAVREKKGRFELANNGTIFLDEVADLPKMLQVKLLRFLQEGCFEKVGGEKTISGDTRVISATNKDLKAEVQKGSFREDLFYRLNVIPINVPPLRERRTDIPLLINHFLGELADKDRRQPLRFSSSAISLMMDYEWPGNVRELQNTIQFSIVRSKGRVIEPEDLPMELRALKARGPKRGPARKLDAAVVQDALTKTGGNKARAARVLGVGRATLYRFLDDYPEVLKDS